MKLANSFYEKLLVSENWLSILEEDSLYEFETKLQHRMDILYDEFATYCINMVAESDRFTERQRMLAKNLSLKKLKFRPVELELRTGTRLKIPDLYANKVPDTYEGDRHLARLLWKCNNSIISVYRSTISLLSVICPSFEVANRVLKYLKVCSTVSKVRKVTLALSEHCLVNRVSIQLGSKESLSGKRVVIGIDGGRSRTRKYTGKYNKSQSHQLYDTPWKEPKLFVIRVIDKEGKIDKKCKALYDCSLGGDDAMFQLLKDYLQSLKIHLAKEVQFLADGAPWIWNRIGSMMEELGVKSERITETLDHYHAIEHIHALMEYVPKKEQSSTLKELKNTLWNGDLLGIARILKQVIPDLDLEKFTPFQYFVKHQYRIDYQSFTHKKLLCGSGMIESGVRRMINLRFKSSSAFWYENNLEKLILLRCIILSDRWGIVIKNLLK